MAVKPEDIKEFIGMLARSDAKHDFKDVSDAKTIDSEFENINKGLANVISKRVADEQGCLILLLENRTGHQ